MNKTDFFHFIRKSDDTQEVHCEDTQHYLNYFAKRDAGGRIFSWNWPAFFVGPIWMIYRKMYFYAFFYSALLIFFIPMTFVVLKSLKIFIPSENLEFVISILLHILFTIFANAIYYNFAERSITKGKKTSGTVSEIRAVLYYIMMYVFFVAAGILLIKIF